MPGDIRRRCRSGRESLAHLISVANVLHCENPLQVEDDWIEEYHLEKGSFNIADVDKDLVNKIPTPRNYSHFIQLISSDPVVAWQ